MWIFGLVLFIIICIANGDSIGAFLTRALLLILFMGSCIANPIVRIAIPAIGLIVSKKN